MIAVCVLCLIGPLAMTEVEARWELASPMPTPRMDAASAVVGDTLYVIGGRQRAGGGSGTGDQGIDDAVEAYVPGENRWLEGLPLLPVPLADMACAVIGQRIYLFGGTTVSNTVVNSVYSWRPGQGTWTVGPDTLPIPLRGASALSPDGTTVLVMGGSDTAGSYVGSVLRFTPGTGFTSEPSLGQARSGAGAGLVDGKALISGGYFHGPLSSTELLTDGAWAGGPALPSARGSALSCNDNAFTFLLGGQGAGAALDEVLSLASAADAWLLREPMIYARARHAGGVAGGYLIAAGGTGPVGYQATGTCERITVAALASPDHEGPHASSPKLRVWPNPFNAGFEIAGDLNAEAPWVASVHTIDGRLVGRSEGISRIPVVRFRAGEDWPNGLYVVTIDANRLCLSRRLVRVR